MKRLKCYTEVDLDDMSQNDLQYFKDSCKEIFIGDIIQLNREIVKIVYEDKINEMGRLGR